MPTKDELLKENARLRAEVERLSSPAELCVVCHKATATRLCDRVLGWAPKIDGVRLVRNPEEWFTCDAPMCSGCAVVEATKHMCGSDGCTTETLDVCPNHVGKRDMGDLITVDQADVLRAQARIMLVAPP